jgi:glutaredoxin
VSTPQKNRRLFLLLAILAVIGSLLGAQRYATSVFVPSANSRDVVVYTTSWCGYCAKLRRDLASSEIPYIEYDAEHSLRGWAGFIALGGRGVPVSAIGPKIVHGYDTAAIAQALREIGYTYKPAREPQPQGS